MPVDVLKVTTVDAYLTSGNVMDTLTVRMARTKWTVTLLQQDPVSMG